MNDLSKPGASKPGASQELLKAMHASLCVRWGTDAPFAIGPVSAEKIGYAAIPAVVCTVTCRDEDLDALVPIVRQRIYGELAERGWTPDDVAFRPTTQRGRRRRFVDENESSDSHGRNKMGTSYRFSFEMSREMARQTFTRGSFARLVERA